jgi:hypothetical protein
MRLLKIHPCPTCQKPKGSIVVDLSDGKQVLPSFCPSPRCTEGAKILHIVEVPEHAVAEILAKLTIDYYPLTPLASTGDFVIDDFVVEQPEPGFLRVTVNLSGRKHPEFKVSYSWERNPLYVRNEGVDIAEGSIPHLAWQAIDIIGHRAHTRTQRGCDREYHWVYLDGSAAESVSDGGTRYRTRARVAWPRS